MKQADIDVIIKSHTSWLNGERGGTRADLSGADLDFSAWPLWCGTVGVVVDSRIAYQLAAHVCAVVCDDPDVIAMQEALRPWAEKSHRAAECLKETQ